MKRFLTDKLVEWKNSKYRKPLILRGARQVGKTYILKDFANTYYDNMAYFNFEHDASLAELFVSTKDPKRIIEQLSFVVGRKIEPANTLIIFDEVQECPDALNSLKYFAEETPEYHIVAAGSLLGIKLSHTSFPVGKVDYLTLYPMTFSEFLIADGKENLVHYMKSIKDIQEIPKIFDDQLIEQLKKYYIIGGMPEVVNSWVNDKDIERVNYLQKNILQAYEDDFSKHLNASEAIKVSLVWSGIPSQLARDNKKFVYQTIKEGARAREYENALNWLNDANLVHKCYNLSKCAFPLSSYNDLSSFKIYLLDVGLLRRMTDLDSNIIIDGNRLFEEFKGSFTENFVCSMLTEKFDSDLHYYTFDRKKIDFVIQYKNNIIPIEVKANVSTNNNSLTKFNKENDNKISVRLSLNNLKQDGKIINIPLYLVEYIDKFI